MIKLKDILKEIEEDEIDIQRLYNNEMYLDEIAEKLGFDMTDFNHHFWNFPVTLYHCTPKENLEVIKTEGLKAKNESRGYSSNKHIGNAIFTTSESEEIEHLKSSYGEIVIGINTKQMKSDRYILTVEREPDWEQADKLAFVMEKLGKDKYGDPSRYVDSSEGTSPYTVIVYGDIPPKYLSYD